MKVENVTTHFGLAVVQVDHFGDIIPVWPAERSSRPHHRKKQSTVPGRGASTCDNGSQPGARGPHLPQSYSKADMMEIRRPWVAATPGIVGEQLGDEQASSPNVHEVLEHRRSRIMIRYMCWSPAPRGAAPFGVKASKCQTTTRQLDCENRARQRAEETRGLPRDGCSACRGQTPVAGA